jgi:hypothetical protein
LNLLSQVSEMPCSRGEVPDEVDIPFIGKIDKAKLILGGSAVGSSIIVLEPLLRGNKND